MVTAVSFALHTERAPATIICVEQHMSIPFKLGGRMRYSSNTRLSDFIVFNFHFLRLFRLFLNNSLAHLSITFRCSTDMMVRSYPIELRNDYGCRLKLVGSALTQHVITSRLPFL